jgi:protein-tyrosine phosphatase
MTQTIYKQAFMQTESESAYCNKRYVDIHCHCLPCIDDGPKTMSEAIELCQALADDGIGTVIATPHQLGRFDNTNEAEQIREAVSIINTNIEDAGIDITILPGADVRVDERLCGLLDADKVMTLCDGRRYLLLELPAEILIDIEPLVTELAQVGISVIISHPERHRILTKNSQKIEKWLEHSVNFQITAGSLFGEFGPEAEESAWFFLKQGWAQIVATDAHDISRRRPCMTAAFKHIINRLGPEVAKKVCIDNPLRIVQSADLSNKYQSRGYCYGGTDNQKWPSGRLYGIMH